MLCDKLNILTDGDFSHVEAETTEDKDKLIALMDTPVNIIKAAAIGTLEERLNRIKDYTKTL